MNAAPLGSLLRALRRNERSALAAEAAAPVTNVAGAARVADNPHAPGTPWPLEPLPDAARARNGDAGLPDDADARFPARMPGNASPPGRDDASARLPVALFAQGTLEAMPSRATGPPGRALSPARGNDEAGAPDAARARPAIVPTGAGRTAAPDAPRDATPKFSAAAQMVSNLMQEPAPRHATGALVQAALPLLPAPAADPPQLAGALQESIARSGLFYESHLAAWALQRGTLEALTREPQARWWAQTSDSATPAMAGGERGSAEVPASLDNVSALRQLRMQLSSLETGRVQWQGELWPRQPAQIAIEADGWSCGSADPSGNARWRSHLRIEMPHLGLVDVELELNGTALAVRVRPKSRLAESSLAAARGEIASALSARFAHSAVTVEHAQSR